MSNFCGNLVENPAKITLKTPWKSSGKLSPSTKSRVKHKLPHNFFPTSPPPFQQLPSPYKTPHLYTIPQPLLQLLLNNI